MQPLSGRILRGSFDRQRRGCAPPCVGPRRGPWGQRRLAMFTERGFTPTQGGRWLIIRFPSSTPEPPQPRASRPTTSRTNSSIPSPNAAPRSHRAHRLKRRAAGPGQGRRVVDLSLTQVSSSSAVAPRVGSACEARVAANVRAPRSDRAARTKHPRRLLPFRPTPLVLRLARAAPSGTDG